MVRKIFISHALIWATIIIANALLSNSSDGAATMQLLLISSWYVSDNLIRQILKEA